MTSGQIAFGALLGLCVALLPHIVIKKSEVGLSNYGVHAATVVPYTLAFLATIVGAIRARRALIDVGEAGPIDRVLLSYAVVMAAVLLSTYAYTRDLLLRDTHIVIGSVAYVVMLVATIALVHSHARLIAAWIGALVVVTGFVMSAVTLAGAWHILFVGQVVTIAGFSCELIATIRTHERRRSSVVVSDCDRDPSRRD